uniref:ribosomal protein L23 n=1 Tax=Prototheca fontanea TaxID=2836215 RepID=UPI0030015650
MILDLLRYPLIYNSKAISLMKKHQYSFDVDKKLTKPQIKILIENYFNIKVLSINTHKPPKKKKRSGIVTRLKRVIIKVNSEIHLYN